MRKMSVEQTEQIKFIGRSRLGLKKYKEIKSKSLHSGFLHCTLTTWTWSFKHFVMRTIQCIIKCSAGSLAIIHQRYWYHFIILTPPDITKYFREAKLSLIENHCLRSTSFYLLPTDSTFQKQQSSSVCYVKSIFNHKFIHLCKNVLGDYSIPAYFRYLTHEWKEKKLFLHRV